MDLTFLKKKLAHSDRTAESSGMFAMNYQAVIFILEAPPSSEDIPPKW